MAPQFGDPGTPDVGEMEQRLQPAVERESRLAARRHRRFMEQMVEDRIERETGEPVEKTEGRRLQPAQQFPDGTKESAPVHRTGGTVVPDGNGYGPVPPPRPRRKLAKGERIPQGEAARRMEMCKQCPELIALDRCRRCGCFMQVKTKIPGARCPLNKW